MKKIFAVLSVSLIIVLAGVILAPIDAQAQMGLDMLDTNENFGLYQDDLNLPSLGMEGNQQAQLGVNSIGGLWQDGFRDFGGGYGLFAIELILQNYYSLAIGLDENRFYFHAGAIFRYYAVEFILFNAGLQLYFNASDLGFGFGLRIPLEFEFAFLPFPLTIYFGPVFALGFISNNDVGFGFDFAIAFGFRFYFS